jgi:hypothetical protein
VTATQALLRTAGIDALARFADFHFEPRASYAEAFAHRFPAPDGKGSPHRGRFRPSRRARVDHASAGSLTSGGPADVDLGL